MRRGEGERRRAIDRRSPPRHEQTGGDTRCRSELDRYFGFVALAGGWRAIGSRGACCGRLIGMLSGL
jgi:hypothetical protein